MKNTSPDNRGYAKVNQAAKYAGVCERTFREWLKNALRHIRLPSGTILIPYAWIDEYLMGFADKGTNQVDEIVNQVVKELRS